MVQVLRGQPRERGVQGGRPLRHLQHQRRLQHAHAPLEQAQDGAAGILLHETRIPSEKTEKKLTFISFITINHMQTRTLT